MIRQILLTMFILLGLSAPMAQAQGMAEPASEMEQEMVSDVQVSSTSGNDEEILVSLDFREADITNVLKVLSFKSGVNIVVGPEVVGLVSIQLKDVPWQEALDVILSTYGYGHEKRGSVIMVTTIENLKKRREDAQLLAEQEPLVTKAFILNYGKASEVIDSISKMKSGRGMINFDQRTNSVIVTDIQSNIDTMGEVIKTLDRVTHQVSIEAKIIETTLSNTENLGIDWTLQANFTGSARPHTYPFTEYTNNKYTFNDNFPGAESGDFTYGTISASQFSAALEILNTRSDTNILSNPSLTTLDNQSASIVVGSQYPIPTYTYNEDQAALQVSGWEYKDIGIIFDVTPHVNNAGMVILDVEPKVTDILDFVTVENTQLPRLSTESAKTRVMIKSGETLVIAGLIKDQVTDVTKKVPLLGDIPILGKAFRKDSVTKTKTELLIFITPRIVTPDDPS